jgi:hypothetical protein
MRSDAKPPAPHIQAAAAAEVQRAIQFTPDFPCYFCGQTTNEAVIRNFVFVPICLACAEKLHTQHELWERPENIAASSMPPPAPTDQPLS